MPLMIIMPYIPSLRKQWASILVTTRVDILILVGPAIVIFDAYARP